MRNALVLSKLEDDQHVADLAHNLFNTYRKLLYSKKPQLQSRGFSVAGAMQLTLVVKKVGCLSPLESMAH